METVKNEYYVSYIIPRDEQAEFGARDTYGYLLAKATDLRGKELLDWLYELAADQTNMPKSKILIFSISMIGSWVVEVE